MRDPDQRRACSSPAPDRPACSWPPSCGAGACTCLLVDALDAPLGWDRATVVHSRSMEIFEALGLADRFLELGVKTRAARIRADGETLGYLDFALVDTRYPFDLGLSEEVTESVLLGHLERQGGTVQRSTRLVGLQQGPDGVLATIERHGERAARRRRRGSSRATGSQHASATSPASTSRCGHRTAWASSTRSIEGCDDDHDVADRLPRVGRR